MVVTTADASATLAWVLPSMIPRVDWSSRNQPVMTRMTTEADMVVPTTRNGSDLAHNWIRLSRPSHCLIGPASSERCHSAGLIRPASGRRPGTRSRGR